MPIADAYAIASAAVAVIVLGSPIAFLVIVGLAVVQRRRTGRVGSTLTALVAAGAGFVLGSMLLVESPIVAEGPIFLVLAFIVVTRWRRGRRVQAGWLLAGAALPWTLLWGWYVALVLVGAEFDLESTLTRFAVGAIWLVVGLWFVRRGDPAPAAPDPAASPGRPGSRQFGSIAEAIRDAARIGPFPGPELAMFVAIIATLFVVGPVVPSSWPRLASFTLPILAAALVGTEVYVRAWPATSRRAFEAFSWLGEWELARARELTGEGVPTSKRAAEAWLKRRPVRREEVPLRTEILLLAGRIDEARRLVEDASAETPAERFELASLRDLVDWRAGGDGDLEGMRTAAGEIEPIDGDERLRAEVSIATSLVRRAMAGAAPDGATAIAPLLAVRDRLGARADGQIGRALRRRVLPVLLIVLALFGLGLELVSGRGLPGL